MFSGLVNQYGLVALGLLILLESAGLPLPGETMLLLAAAAAAQGVLPIGAVIAVAASAAIIGDSVGYWIGRRYGLALLTRYGRWLRITPAHLDRAQAFFQRHGPKTVFLGRFVAMLRVLSAVLAGVSRMPYRVFLAYNALGGIVWATVIGFLGFQFGNQLPVIQYALQQAGWVMAGIAIVGLLGFFGWRWLVRHQGLVRTRFDHAIEWIEQRRLMRGLEALRGRLPGWSYLGVYTSSGLVISVLSLLAFTQIADSALGQETLAMIDLRLAAKLHAAATPLATQLMLFVTALGGRVVIVIALAGVLALAAWRRWADLVVWIGALGGGAILTALLKALIQRPRPVFANPISVETSWSFPSGHALMAVVTYGLLTYLLVVRLHQWRWQVALVLASTFLILLIGFSRLYLGVHYVSDVLAGYAAGLCWLATCLSAQAYCADTPAARVAQPAQEPPHIAP